SAAIVVGFSAAAVDPRIPALVAMAFAASILALALGMLSSHRRLWTTTHAALDRWTQRTGSAAPWVLAGIAAFVTVREATEIALFLRSLAQRRELQQVATGAALGGLASALLAWVY